VRSIVEVFVEDDGQPCSTDEAIEAALKGFEVQRLHWKRIDIPSDVFHNSTSVLRVVSLYWSGDVPVLERWSSPEWLSNEKKFPEVSILLQVLLTSALEGRPR